MTCQIDSSDAVHAVGESNPPCTRTTKGFAEAAPSVEGNENTLGSDMVVPSNIVVDVIN